jgi:hypothetical protein
MWIMNFISTTSDKRKERCLVVHLRANGCFRLGFGSFVDKVVMPYVSTVPRKLEEPCEGCAAPYGFKHHMRLRYKFSLQPLPYHWSYGSGSDIFSSVKS